jgi:5-methylcytosine-specific restriction enzyme subunit McrC
VVAAVPILNIFYLFCYAWNHVREGLALSVGGTPGPNAVNLFGHVLLNGTRRLLKTGLERDYRLIEEELVGVRGRVLFDTSLKRLLFKQAKACCAFDELSYDTLHNQILKTTLSRLLDTDGIDYSLRQGILEVLRTLPGISLIPLAHGHFRRTRVHRNNAFYDFIIKVCELLHGGLLPTEQEGRFRFSNVLNDETRKSVVFEEIQRAF